MNMKKVLKFIPILILFIFLNIKVDASTCDGTTKKNLKQEAKQVAFSLDLNKPTSEGGADSSVYSYNLMIQNVSKNLSYKIGDWFYNYNEAVDNELYIKNAYMMGGYKVTIKIYGSASSGCAENILRSVSLYIPYYNQYSDRKECEGLREYSICKTNTNTENLSEDDFLKKINEIKTKAKEEKVEDEEKKEKSSLDETINFINENKNIIIPIFVILVVLVIIVIIIKVKENKNKIKVDLGDDLK